MCRFVPALAAALMAVGVMSAPAGAQESATGDTCPAVALVAARGSEESVELGPTRYAAESPWVSNGFEGNQIGNLLRFAESHHLEQTGESLLVDVPVLSLADTIYPAAFPLPALAGEGEELEAVQVLARVQQLLERVSVPEIARISLGTLAASVHAGASGAAGYLTGWEEATGCQPQYILIGYSQGAIVLTAQEQDLAEQGRLAGVIYLGNPWVKPHEPSLVGGASPGGGLLQGLPAEWQATAPGIPRINYCLPDDLVCDSTPAAAADFVEDAANTDGFGAHTDYFTGEAPTETDEYVAEELAAWIKAAQDDYTSAS